MTSGSEKEIRLGAVARAMAVAPDLFAPVAEPMKLSTRLLRFPDGPAISLREPAGLPQEEIEAERWDGLC